MSHAGRRFAARVSLLSACAVLALSLISDAQTTQRKVAKKAEQNRDLDGRFAAKSLMTAEGVIKDLEIVGTSKKGEHRPRRIQLNRDIVWRDWVRDQATVTDARRSNTAEAAEKGKKSVATLGAPTGVDSLVTLEVPLTAKVETRFKSSTDEISDGATTPGRAGDAEKASDASDKQAKKKMDDAPKKKTGAASANAPGAQLADLKSGLFIEVEYTEKDGKNVASRVRILRPVGGSSTPADQAKPR